MHKGKNLTLYHSCFIPADILSLDQWAHLWTTDSPGDPGTLSHGHDHLLGSLLNSADLLLKHLADLQKKKSPPQLPIISLGIILLLFLLGMMEYFIKAGTSQEIDNLL